MRFPVQWVNRPNLDFRGYAGTIASGTIAKGEPVVVANSGKTTIVERVIGPAGDLDRAEAGDAVTLTLRDEVDIARGDVLAPPQERPAVADQFAATLIWMSDEKLLPGRSYLMKLATRTVPVTITALKHRIDVNTLEQHIAAKTLSLNEIGRLQRWRPRRRSPSIPTRRTSDTGAFILIDRMTNATAAAGLVDHRAAARHQHSSSRPDGDTSGAGGPEAPASERSCGSPACRDRASRPSPTSSNRGCTRLACTRRCSTATMSGMD